jgi:hypothetical protein
MSSQLPQQERQFRLVQWLADHSQALDLCQENALDSRARASWAFKRRVVCGPGKAGSKFACEGLVFGSVGNSGMQPISLPCPCAYFSLQILPFYLEALVRLPWGRLIQEGFNHLLIYSRGADRLQNESKFGFNPWYLCSLNSASNDFLEKELSLFLISNLSIGCFRSYDDPFIRYSESGLFKPIQKTALIEYRTLTRAMQIVNSPLHCYLDWGQLKSWKEAGQFDFSSNDLDILKPKKLVVLNLRSLKLTGIGGESYEQEIFEELIHRLYDLRCGLIVFAGLPLFELDEERDGDFESRIVPEIKNQKNGRKRVVWRDKIKNQSFEECMSSPAFQRLGSLLMEGKQMFKILKENDL